MKNKSKKSIIIIIFVALLLIFSIIFFIKNDENNKQILSCYLKTKNLYAEYDLMQKIEYEDEKFTHVELEQKMYFNLKENSTTALDNMRETLEQNFSEKFKIVSADASYYVKIEDGALVFGFSMNSEDYKLIEKSLKDDSTSITTIDNFYDDPNEIINNITNAGGECSYE